MEIVVLGGSYAGLGAAIRASRLIGRRGRVRLVTQHPRFYERIRLHELANRSALIETELTTLLDGTGVELYVGRVDTIDLSAKRAHAQGSSFAFDRLVVALGSHTDRTIPGADRFAHTLDDPRGAEALNRALVTLSLAGGGEVLVIGGGLTAIEAAAEIAEAMPSLSVSLVSMAPIADELSLTARKYLAKRLGHMGVDVSEGVRIKHLEEGKAHTSRGSIPFSICVLAGGFTASSIAKTSGLEVSTRGQMRVNKELRSVSHPFVYGVGDAAMPDESVGAPIVMSCRTALPMAFHAADNLARELDDRDLTNMQFSDSGRCVSLGRNDGLVTIHRSDGSLTEHIITGRAGAFVKEGICKYTIARIRAEALRSRLMTKDVGPSSAEPLDRSQRPIRPLD